MNEIIRLASPAERWGGFGTCVWSKAHGKHSPTPRGLPTGYRNQPTTTTWHSPELAAHGSPGAPPCRLGNQPIGFLNCKPQTTALPKARSLSGPATLHRRSPEVSALPRSKRGDWPADSDSERTLTRTRTGPGGSLPELTAQLRGRYLDLIPSNPDAYKLDNTTYQPR